MSGAKDLPPDHRSFPERFFDIEIRAWRGEADLFRVFWVQGVLTSVVLGVLHATTILLGQMFAEQILLILLTLYSIWIVVSIWRCSLASDTFGATIARYLASFWALNAGLVLVFRQLDLLVLIAGRAGLLPF